MTHAQEQIWAWPASGSDEQIIGMIREHEPGVKTSELCRKLGISDATFYKY
jgi:putative transposase